MWTNILLSTCFALGVFLILISPRLTFVARDKTVDRVNRFMQTDQPLTDNFLQNVRKAGLAVALAQADLDITPAGFYRTGVIIAGIAAAGAFVFTGGFVVAAFVGLVSILLYLHWLFWRRDRRKMQYEEGLAEIASSMSAGALITSTLTGAISHAALLAPPAVKPDFQQVSGLITQGSSINEAFADIRKRRQSYSLDLLADTLLVWSTRGSNVPLSKVLMPLTETIREMASERNRMEAELSGERMKMIFVSVFPFVMVTFLRQLFPGAKEVLASDFGQVLQIVSYSISAVGYVLSERALGKVRQVLDLESANQTKPNFSEGEA